jgi:hypothetical protein
MYNHEEVTTLQYNEGSIMKQKRDLLIHYDEANGKLIFYSIGTCDTESIRANTFDGVCPDVAFFKGKTADEAERTLGAMVFANLDHSSIDRIRIRDYEMESALVRQVYVAELEVAAQEGDPEAQYHLSIEYHSRALRYGILSDLQRAESLLLASADAGWAGAIELLGNWPLLKEVAEARIQRSLQKSE